MDGMKTKLVPPELINLENQMDEWFAIQRGEISDPVADYLNAHPPEKPWKLKALIVFGLMCWFWYEVGEYFVRAMR